MSVYPILTLGLGRQYFVFALIRATKCADGAASTSTVTTAAPAKRRRKAASSSDDLTEMPLLSIVSEASPSLSEDGPSAYDKIASGLEDAIDIAQSDSTGRLLAQGLSKD